MEFDTDVLVVGAGPTGLVAAAQLVARGVGVRLIDAQPERSDKSRALVVHARSLELLDKMGLADRLIDVGLRSMGLNAHFDGKHGFRVDLGALDIDHTPFPFLLFLSQVETERALDAHLDALGLPIERPVRLTGFTQDDDGVTALVERDGTTETIHARYIIGADGAHSVVRHTLGLSFDGDAYPSAFVLGDVTLTGDITKDESHVFLARGVTILFPMPEGQTRVMCTAADDGTDEAPTLEGLQERVNALTRRDDLVLSQPTWLARFRLHHRGVRVYGVGRAFVAGDAAHIHSPAGGQGMNTGIQDAFNLAWKLAMVVRGEAPAGLLDSYTAERLPVGERLLKFTDRAFSIGSTLNPVLASVRNFLGPRLGPRLVSTKQSQLFAFASQTGIRYRRSPAVAEDLEGADARFVDGPRAGDRAPGVGLADGRRFLRLLTGEGWWLLGFTGTGDAATGGVRWRARLQGALHGYPWVRTIMIGSGRPEGDGPWIEEPNDSEALHRRYGLSGPGLYLVRPDGHIAFRSAGARIDPLCAWLDAAFAV